MEAASPKVDPVPPPKGLAKIWKHVKDWQSIYFFVPIALFSIWMFAQFGYFLTGRRPQENVDWMIGIAANLVKLVFLIVFVEICRQATGHWYTKEQMMANPELSKWQTISKCVTLVVGAYILSH